MTEAASPGKSCGGLVEDGADSEHTGVGGQTHLAHKGLQESDGNLSSDGRWKIYSGDRGQDGGDITHGDRFSRQGEVAGIFTGSRTIRRLRKDYWNMLFSLGEPVTLRGLAPEEARMLIEQPVSGRLVYAEEAVENIVRLTACQPLLIQGICKRIFALCKQRNQSSVSLELVEEVVAEKTADNEHFETLWGYIRSERCRCILFVIDELAAQDVVVGFNALRTAIEDHGIVYLRKELEADLKYLAESDIIGVNWGDRQEFYRLEVPMFALWLRRNKDFTQSLAAAKEELL